MCTTVITRCECGYRHTGCAFDTNADTDPIAVLRQYRDRFTEAFVTVKGPSVGGTRYEAEREIDARIAAELVMRGGCPIIKNRFSAWIGEDGWSLDIFGGANAPLVVAEAERSGPVTNLQIPSFCVTRFPDQARFSNDGLASRPFCSGLRTSTPSCTGTGPDSKPSLAVTAWDYKA